MLNPTKIIFTLSICLLSACQLNNANSENVQLKNLFKQNFTSESIAIVDISDFSNRSGAPAIDGINSLPVAGITDFEFISSLKKDSR